jgi:hypothetical protein
MCWVTLRIVDNHQVATASPEQRRQLWQRGDIVDVADEHPGPGVTASPRLLAINFPGVPASQLQDFVEGSEIGRRAKKWRIDAALAAMPAQARKIIVDAVRDRTDIELTTSQMRWIRDYLEARV